jgi:hypothetical protein
VPHSSLKRGSQIAAYGLVPAPASIALGHILPFAEVSAGIAVLAIPRIGGGAVALLFATFAFAVAINLLRGRTELVCRGWLERQQGRAQKDRPLP